MINNALFCVCFLSFFFVLLIFLFFFSFLFFLCVCVVYSWLSFGRLTFIYEKNKSSIIHYFLYYLFLQTKCVGNLSMVFSIQKAKCVFIWSKWRLMGIILRHSNIIYDFAEGIHMLLSYQWHRTGIAWLNNKWLCNLKHRTQHTVLE